MRITLLSPSAAPHRPRGRAWVCAWVLWGVASAALGQGVPAKVLAGLESSKVRVRIASVIAVSKSEDPTARRILEGMLGDKDASVRAAAVEGLGRLGDQKAIPALEKATKDPDKLVRKVAEKTLAALRDSAAAAPAASSTASTAATQAVARAKPLVTVDVDVSTARDFSGRARPEDLALLRTEVLAALAAEPRVESKVAAPGASIKGYGLLLAVRSIDERKEAGASFVDVKCEMTLVALPSKALRLQAAATAGAGVEGTLSDALRVELVVDGIRACAPALARDFLDYALSRGG